MSIALPLNFRTLFIKSRYVPRGVVQIIVNQHDWKRFDELIRPNMEHAVAPDPVTGKSERDGMDPPYKAKRSDLSQAQGGSKDNDKNGKLKEFIKKFNDVPR